MLAELSNATVLRRRRAPQNTSPIKRPATVAALNMDATTLLDRAFEQGFSIVTVAAVPAREQKGWGRACERQAIKPVASQLGTRAGCEISCEGSRPDLGLSPPSPTVLEHYGGASVVRRTTTLLAGLRADRTTFIAFPVDTVYRPVAA